MADCTLLAQLPFSAPGPAGDANTRLRPRQHQPQAVVPPPPPPAGALPMLGPRWQEWGWPSSPVLGISPGSTLGNQSYHHPRHIPPSLITCKCLWLCPHPLLSKVLSLSLLLPLSDTARPAVPSPQPALSPLGLAACHPLVWSLAQAGCLVSTRPPGSSPQAGMHQSPGAAGLQGGASAVLSIRPRSERHSTGLLSPLALTKAAEGRWLPGSVPVGPAQPQPSQAEAPGDLGITEHGTPTPPSQAWPRTTA